MNFVYCFITVLSSIAVLVAPFENDLIHNVERYKSNNFRWNIRNFNHDTFVSLRKLEEGKDMAFSKYVLLLNNVRKRHNQQVMMYNAQQVHKLVSPRSMMHMPSQDWANLPDEKVPDRTDLDLKNDIKDLEKRYRVKDEQSSEKRTSQPFAMMYSGKNTMTYPQSMQYNSRLMTEMWKPQSMMYNSQLMTEMLKPQSMMYNDPNQPQPMMYNAKQKRSQPQFMMYHDKLQDEMVMPQTMKYNSRLMTEMWRPQSMMYNSQLMTEMLKPQSMMYNDPNQPQPMMYNAKQKRSQPQFMMYHDKLQDEMVMPQTMKYNSRLMTEMWRTQSMMYNSQLMTEMWKPQSMMYNDPNQPESVMYNTQQKRSQPQFMMYHDKLQDEMVMPQTMKYNSRLMTEMWKPQSMMYNSQLMTEMLKPQSMMYNSQLMTEMLKPQSMMYIDPNQPQPMMYNAKQKRGQPQFMMYHDKLQDEMVMPQTMKYNSRLMTEMWRPQSMMYNSQLMTEMLKPQSMMYNDPNQPQPMMYNTQQKRSQPQFMMYHDKLQDEMVMPQTMKYNSRLMTEMWRPQSMMYNSQLMTEMLKPQSMMYNDPNQPQPMMYNAKQKRSQPQFMMYHDKLQDEMVMPQTMKYNSRLMTEMWRPQSMMYNSQLMTEMWKPQSMMYNSQLMTEMLKPQPMMYNDPNHPESVMYNTQQKRSQPQFMMYHDKLQDEMVMPQTMKYNSRLMTEMWKPQSMMYNSQLMTEMLKPQSMMYNSQLMTEMLKPQSMMYIDPNQPQPMMYNAKQKRGQPQFMMYHDKLQDEMVMPQTMKYNSRLMTEMRKPQSMMYNSQLMTEMLKPQSMMYIDPDQPQPMMYNAKQKRSQPQFMMYHEELPDDMVMPQTMKYNSRLMTEMRKPQSMMYNSQLMAEMLKPQSMMYIDPNQPRPMMYTDQVKRSQQVTTYNTNLSCDDCRQNDLQMEHNKTLQPSILTEVNSQQGAGFHENNQVRIEKADSKDTSNNTIQSDVLDSQQIFERRNVSVDQPPKNIDSILGESIKWFEMAYSLVKTVPESVDGFFNHWKHTISIFDDKKLSREHFLSNFQGLSIKTVVQEIAKTCVFEKLFWPFVYKNAFMNQKLGLLGLSGLSIAPGKQKSVFYEILEKYQTLKIPFSQDRIVYSFNDPDVVDGLNRSGLMETSKEYVETGHHLFTPDEQSAILLKVDAAMTLINKTMPELYKSLHQVIASIAFYKAQHAGFAGGTVSSALGIIWQDPRAYKEQSVAHYAEQIVHEFIHTSLFLADLVHGTFADLQLLSRAKVYSPIRHELRDFDKVFHASYVSTGVAVFHARAGNWDKAQNLLDPLRTSVDGLVKLNKAYGVLNDSGNAMLQAMDDFLTLIRLV